VPNKDKLEQSGLDKYVEPNKIRAGTFQPYNQMIQSGDSHQGHKRCAQYGAIMSFLKLEIPEQVVKYPASC